ncbi:MAG: GNAT family N-acetyltransferase [Bacillota bacterium]
MGIEIRELQANEFYAAQLVFSQAYPWLKNQNVGQIVERISANKELHKNDWMKFYGVWLDDALAGVFIQYQFLQNFRGKIFPIAGIGAVGVDWLKKKRHVAKSLIEYFITTNAAKGNLFTALYPFRPDFYKQMGYALGHNLFEYRFQPGRLINDDSSDGLQHLDKRCLATQQQLEHCYDRHHAKTHGSINKWSRWWNKLVDDDNIWIIGEYRDEVLTSYLAFKIEKLETGIGDGMDLCVEEIVGADSAAWRQYRSFLATQSDQFRTINIVTAQKDFQYNFTDPRFYDNTVGFGWKFMTARQSMGMMQRICRPRDCWQHFSEINFGAVSTVVEFSVVDSLLGKVEKFTVEFFGGYPNLSDQTAEFSVELEIAEYTALLMGSADVKALVYYGKVKVIANEGVEVLARLFNSGDYPENGVYF